MRSLRNDCTDIIQYGHALCFHNENYNANDSLAVPKKISSRIGVP